MSGFEIGLAHAARGRRVFPWRPVTKPGNTKPEKKPLTEHGHKDATTDEATIIAWAKRWPNARYGWALPEGVGLVDVDDPGALEAAGLDLPPAPEQRGTLTRPDGLHRLYAVQDGRQTQGAIPGIDTRVGGDGWVALYSADAFAGDPPPAPAWFPRKTRPTNGVGIGPIKEYPARAAIETGSLFIPAGKRDGTLASIAGTLIAAGGTAESTTIALQLLNAAGAIEQPPGDRIEDFDRIANSVARKAAAAATTAPALESLIVGIDAYRTSVPTAIPWLCRPIAYSGGVTLIAGPPKAGKSTLAAQLQRCRETGDTFLGAWPVTVGPVLLVTEEGGVAVVYKTNGLHGLDILDRRAAAGMTFAQVLEAIGGWAASHPGGLAFIDTLAIWAGIENENDAGEATRAVAAVTALAQSTELAIALIHHARKSGGDNGEAIRGSGAILATVDIAVELSRVSPTSDDRWIDIQGRVIMPERFLLTFDRLTQTYALGDQDEVRLEEIEADLVGIPADGPGLTRNDLNGIWRKDPRKRAEQLLNVGRLRSEWVQQGRGWGWRYWSIPAVWTPSDD